MGSTFRARRDRRRSAPVARKHNRHSSLEDAVDGFASIHGASLISFSFRSTGYVPLELVPWLLIELIERLFTIPTKGTNVLTRSLNPTSLSALPHVVSRSDAFVFAG